MPSPHASQRSSHKAHMTWASKSVRRTVQSAGIFLRRQIWLWPIIAVLVLSSVGLLVRGAIESTMKETLRSAMQTLLDVEVAMLRTWLDGQERNAESLANDTEIRRLVASVLADSGAITDGADAATPVATRAAGRLTEAQAGLIEALGPAMTSYDYDGFFVIDKSKTILAGYDTAAIGRDDFVEDPGFDEFFSRALGGDVCVSRPLPSVLPLEGARGRVQTGTPVMFAAAPVRDENFQVVAALALRMRPEQEFTRILQLGRTGESGETYAFDSEGLMLSASRFEEDLILLGILADEPGSRSILKALVRDPGGNIVKGFRPNRRRHELPPTKMVAAAVESGSGVDVEGYRDYRGVPVVGAWTWLDEYGFGVATEMDAAEAYRPLFILHRMHWGVFTLLGLSSVAIFVFTLQVARLRREAQEAAVEAQQLGQYKLEHKLGAGAMGVVYKGRHAMLRRACAIKMLEPSKVDEVAIAAFEREVQITSQLCHPNTVAIYDYGHTPEGLFYYAMEYLDGISLEDLVDTYGPQPVGRVVDLLEQICGSLYEAHTEGLVHRDIKPANIMLNRRGADPDVIKVLDFGLVKDLGEHATSGMAGTPLYMSPEAIQQPASVDARSDLYAVGAVGYFLLTGRTVFQASGINDLMKKHLKDEPAAPSTLRGEALPEELEDAILACLDKNRAKRPQTARDLVLRLQRVPTVDDWNVERADIWWNQHARGTAPTAKRPTLPRGGGATVASKGDSTHSETRPPSADDQNATIDLS